MIRLKLLIIVLGGMAMFFGFQEGRLASKCSSEPHKMTCEELAKNGPGDNANIELTDFVVGENFVYEQDGKTKAWNHVWVPLHELDMRTAIQLMGEHPVLPTTFRVLMKTSKAKSVEQIDNIQKGGTIKGLVVNNITKISGKELDLLQSSYRGTDFSKVWIIDHERSPHGYLFAAGAMLGGLLLAGVGVWSFIPSNRSVGLTR